MEGDDKDACKQFKKRNKLLRKGQQSLALFAGEPTAVYDALAEQVQALEAMDDHDVAGLEAKAARFAELERSQERRRQRLIADAWCAAFTAPKQTDVGRAHPFETFYELNGGPDAAAGVAEIERQADTYEFFHWHLEFPHLYRPVEDIEDPDHLGWRGGFTVMLGNPPWEHTELKEKEWFASRSEEIATAMTGAARKKLIKQLAQSDPPLYDAFTQAKREHDNYAHFSRGGRYPLTATGRTNTYALFAELFRDGIAETGRAGVVVPTGIATDHTTRHFFADLVDNQRLASVFDFENRAGIFPAVDSRMKFALLTISGVDAPVEEAEFAFFAHDTADLRDPDRRFVLTPTDIALINPNTKTAPVFRTRRDAEITAKIYRNVPVLVRDGDPDGNSWGVTFKQGLFNMTSDSHLFRTRDQLEADGWTLGGTPVQCVETYIPSNVFTKADARYLPLYEAKMIHHFDHRWATYEGDDTRDMTTAEKKDPNCLPLPRYWVASQEVDEKVPVNWGHPWLIGFRDITNTTNERTNITALLPRSAVGNQLPLLFPTADDPLLLAAVLSSFAHDYAARRKAGGTHLNFYIFEQLPVLTPAQATSALGRAFVVDRARELTFNSVNLEADEVYRWEPARRELLRAELDAAMFHLYGLDRDEVDYIMDTFPIVKRKDEAKHGEFRTKRLILEVYDDLAKRLATDTPYQTRLDPPPADPSLLIPRHSRSRQ